MTGGSDGGIERNRGLFGLLAGLVLAAGLLPAQGFIPTETVERLSVSSADSEATQGSDAPVVSGDGRYVAFESLASNLVSGDSNNRRDVFVRDRALGVTICVSVSSSGALGNGDSFRPAFSADGRYVAFESLASNLVPGDTNGRRDVFLHDLVTGTTTRVSVSSNGTEANDHCFEASVATFGGRVTFHSAATNLVAGDTNGTDDVFVHDTVTGVTTRVSENLAGVEGNGGSSGAVISANGRVVVFASFADNLVPGDGNNVRDLFARNLQHQTLQRVSVDSAGNEANAISGLPGANWDGTVIAFWSNATNLVAGDTNIVGDVFVRETLTGTTSRVSVGSNGAQANGQSGSAFGTRISTSSDGRFVAFSSLASNLDGADANQALDVFVRDRLEATTHRVSRSTLQVGGNLASFGASISVDGRLVVFASTATNLVTGDQNGVRDVFAWNRGPWTDLGSPLAGTGGPPELEGRGTLQPFSPASLDLTQALPAATAWLSVAITSVPVAYAGGVVQAWPPQVILVLATDATGGLQIPFTFPGGPTGAPLYFQYALPDPGAAQGLSLSNALLGTTP